MGHTDYSDYFITIIIYNNVRKQKKRPDTDLWPSQSTQDKYTSNVNTSHVYYLTKIGASRVVAVRAPLMEGS